MSATVRELCDLVGGTVQGDDSLVVVEAHSLPVSKPGDITFLENDKQAKLLKDCKASAVVTTESLPGDEHTFIRCKDPLTAFLRIVQHLRGILSAPPTGVDVRADVHPSVVLGTNCTVRAGVSIGEGSSLGARCVLHPGAVVGRNCRLGDDVVLHPNVVLYDGCIVGHRTTIHGGSVIGADGFGYRMHQGKHVKLPHLGHVEIGDDVEIGACVTIDRGMIEPTVIGTGTKIDNLVMIGHNCRIGAHNLFAGQVGIAGSCSTGAYVVLAGQVGMADHVHIGDRALLGAQSGVHCDIPSGSRWWGTPAMPEHDAKKVYVTMARLVEMRRDIQRIKSRLGPETEEEAA